MAGKPIIALLEPDASKGGLTTEQVRVRLERTLAAANAYIHAMTAVYF